MRPPGISVSATICAFSSADQRRWRPLPIDMVSLRAQDISTLCAIAHLEINSRRWHWTERHRIMIDGPSLPGENQKAAVLALIERLQPGEMLKIGERAVAQYSYDRVIPDKTPSQDKYLERIWPDYEVMHEIQMMIEGLMKAGDLVETGYRWHWSKPQPNRPTITTIEQNFAR